MKRHRFPIRHNVYNRAITFLVGSVDEINAELKRECPDDAAEPDLSPDCIGHWLVYRHNGYEADYICLVTRKRRAEMIAALAHECLHHTAHVLRKAGMPLADESEEAYCYYFQWVFENCLEAMR